MNFAQAIASGFKEYFIFQSPSSLTETGAAPTQVLVDLFQLVTFVPRLAVEIRRLHDVDRPGWWLLLHTSPSSGFCFRFLSENAQGEPSEPIASGHGGCQNGASLLLTAVGSIRHPVIL